MNCVGKSKTATCSRATSQVLAVLLWLDLTVTSYPTPEILNLFARDLIVQTDLTVIHYRPNCCAES